MIRIHLKLLKRLSTAGNNELFLGLTETGFKVYLDLKAIVNHIGIFGQSGYGKSTTVKRILDEAFKNSEMPYFVFDWHGEYRDLITLHGGEYFVLGSEIMFNPLQIGIIRDPYEKASFLAEMFSEGLYLTQPQTYMLRRIILNILDEGEPLTISTLLNKVERWHVGFKSSYEKEVKWALLRRLESFRYGMARRIFDLETPDFQLNFLIPSAVSFQPVFENTLRRFVAYTILKMLHAYALSGKLGKRLFFVLEEARNVVPSRSRWDPPSLGEKLISELRKYNVSFIVVSQLPSQISEEVFRSLSTKIFHRIYREEVPTLRGHNLSELNVGEAILDLGYRSVKIRVMPPLHHKIFLEIRDHF